MDDVMWMIRWRTASSPVRKSKRVSSYHALAHVPIPLETFPHALFPIGSG
jgi:hypothetical protein